jgi:hypothetical protein
MVGRSLLPRVTARASLEGTEVPENSNREITLVIVYGVNKPLTVQNNETIETIKLDGMELFGVPRAEKDKFVLKAKIDGNEEQLDEAQTVEHYHLKNGMKVTLAAGAPFGDQ